MAEHYLRKTLYGGIVATFFVPLLVFPNSFIFPFIVPKILAFRALTLIMAGLYAMLLTVNWRQYRPRWTPLTLAVALFFLSFVLSTFFGVDWYHSFWDNHERMLGLFTVTHFILGYVILTSTVRSWDDWRTLLRLFLVAASVVLILGVYQKIDPSFLLNRGSDRTSSTLGNPIYYSGYGLFAMFVGMILAVDEWRRIGSRYLWLALALLGFVAIFLGGTRGTVVGLMTGGLVMCIIYAVTLKEHPQLQRACRILPFVGAAMVILLFSFRQTRLVSNLPAIGRLVNTPLSSLSNDTRVMAWGVAIDAWREHPVFGWGPNNFYYAFNQYYRPEFLRHGWGETWFDNAHNIIMNTLATQGFVGILTYVGIFAAALWSLWRARRANHLTLHVSVLSIGFLVAHFTHNVFVFENPTSYLYFFFFLAFVNSVTMDREAESETVKSGSGRAPSWGAGIVCIVLVSLLVYATDINPKRANTASLRTIQKLYADPEQVVADYEQAIQIPSPHVDDIRNDFARTINDLVPQLRQAGRDDLAKQLVVLAYDELQKNRELHPLDIRVHLLQAQLAYVRADLMQDPQYLLAAESIFEDALTKSPKRQQIQFALVPIKLQLKKYDQAIALSEAAFNNDPTISDAWWRLAWVYAETGEMAKAKQVIAQADQAGINFVDQGQEVAQIIRSST